MSQSKYSCYAATVLFLKKNSRMKVFKHHPDIELYGIGRSAAVFKIISENRVIKIFYPSCEKTAIQEKQNYEKLKGSNYYPALYETGENYLVMDFVEGKTFFQCLAEGIPLKSCYIEEVDKGLQYAKEVGLNPSDIHLHNLIVTPEDQIRIIDVARFSQKKHCNQWDDLKRGYIRYYNKPFFPKKLPTWVMYTVSKLYRLSKHSLFKKY